MYFIDPCLYEYHIQLLFQIDLVLTCEELLESRSIKKLFNILHIHRWYAIQKSEKMYPNAPETWLPKWFKGGKNDQKLVEDPGNKKSDRARSWIAKRYAKWWISDDYTSGVNICNKINPPQVVNLVLCYIIVG